MAEVYFNEWEFQQALSLVGNNYLEAKVRYEKYLEKYPKDYSAYPYYATLLIALGEFDEAEKILEYVEKISSKDSRFANEFNRIKLLSGSILYGRLKLFSYQERYDELYQLCLNNRQYIESMDMNYIYFYCKKKKGTLDTNLREANSYLFRQIIDYKESNFLHHIKKHLADYNSNIDKPNNNIFVPNFPINEILSEVKKYIPSDKRIYLGFFDNTYVFKYNECGRVNNKLVDYFKVICFHNTKDFISIVPVPEGENLPHVDLNYMVRDNEQDIKSVKAKRMSQIDKFNQKYKRS